MLPLAVGIVETMSDMTVVGMSYRPAINGKSDTVTDTLSVGRMDTITDAASDGRSERGVHGLTDG